MFLRRLEIVQFKNHSEKCLDFTQPINFIFGKNGIGKTNILDAIFYTSVFRSHIHNVDTQNIQEGLDFFRIKAQFSTDYQVIVKYASRNKTIEINQNKISKYSEYFGHIPLVLASPADIFLLHDGSEERRKWLDYTISIYNKEYLQRLNDYQNYLEQRNTLLKHESIDISLIEFYNAHLSRLGQYIYATRQEAMNEISLAVKKWYTEIAESSERIEVIYSSQLMNENLDTLFKQSFEKDKILKRTTCGIHRDDIKIEMGQFDLKKIGSQGQQKSLLYALRLGQAEFISQKLQKKLIFLLDDFSDKLDSHRQKHLLNVIQTIPFVSQWFITDVGMNPTILNINNSEVFQL